MALPNLTQQPQAVDEEVKYAHQEVEDAPLKEDILHHSPLKSAFDGLTIFQTLRVFWKTVLICALAGFSASTDGFQNKISANIVANKGFVTQFAPAGMAKPELRSEHVSTFGGMFSAGQVLGQFGIQYVAEYLGRRCAAWTFMALQLIAVVVEITSKEWWHFTIAKTIAGFGVGASQAVLPLYINEHAPVQIRGVLLVAYSLWFSLGGLFGAVTLKARGDSHPNDWKSPLMVQFGMVGISALIFLFLPESPWWLVFKGKEDKARKVLERKYGNIEGYDVDTELAVLVGTVEKQRQYNAEMKLDGRFAIFKGLNLKRFLIASWPKSHCTHRQVLQQFVGLSVFSSYSAYFFKLAGNKDPFSVTVILGCTGLAAVIFDAFLVDKIGRRRMTLIGFGGACLGVTLMAIIGCFDYETPQLGAVLVFAGVWASFFNWFQSSTSYAYLTEIPDQRFRAKSVGWGLAYCNLYAVMFNFTVPLMLKVWKVKTAFLFVGLGIPGTILAYFIMPESMNRSPSEIDEMLQEGVSLRKWNGHITAVERDLAARQGNTAMLHA